MDLSLKTCTTLVEEQHQRDKLSCLPNELLIKILSLIPTKDALVVCVLLRKRLVFPWITGLDFDASPICHCLIRPNQTEHFSSFLTFVDSVLQAHQTPYLTRFRLNVGVYYYMSCIRASHWFYKTRCNEGCLPDLKIGQINAWITFSLARYGLRVLELRIHVRGPPGQSQLPPAVFMKETLEVLKLNVNLSFDGISNFRLPKLKTLHLYASIISEDAFLTNLVSSCPLLEKLKVSAWWNHVRFTKISSPSLRSLSLVMLKLEDEDNSDLVVLDTPNLEYLLYLVSLQYSITSMPHLVKAEVDFSYALRWESLEMSCQQMLTLIKALSNVHYLCLDGVFSWIFTRIQKKKQLPVFSDLILLELGKTGRVERKALVAFLYRAPNMETLVFPRGFGEEERGPELEKESRRLTLATIPWCCKYNLKRIVVHGYSGSEREIMYSVFAQIFISFGRISRTH